MGSDEETLPADLSKNLNQMSEPSVHADPEVVIEGDQLNVQIEGPNADADEDKAHNPSPDKKRKKTHKRKKDPKQYRSITLTGGVIFNGISNAKTPATGNGQLVYPDGSVYIGEVKMGVPNGHGEKVWAKSSDGEETQFLKTYVGNWQNGTMEGFGELALQQGELYIGHFSDGYPNGQGIRKWSNGDFYEGNYLNGYQNGHGMFLS